jgi:O-antigen ligase
LNISDKQKFLLVISSSLAFLAISIVFLAHGNYVVMGIPFALFFALLGIFYLDKLLLLIVFFAPLSITLSNMGLGGGNNLYIPTEPLLLGVLILFLLKVWHNKNFDKRIALHPISIAIYANLIWILITSFTSTMPGVSFKFLLSRLWFVVPFFFLGTQLFRKLDNIKRYIWAYTIALLIVIGYTLIRLNDYGLLNQKAAHFVVKPFFNDHTSYGAALAMIAPLIITFIALYKNKSFKTITWIVLIIFIFALIFSYTRAAWVSIIGGFLSWVIIKYRIKFKYILGMLGVIIILLFVYQDRIVMMLEQNDQESTTNIAKHAQSITNITSDASNLERINRWNCAIRMFQKKPFFGWGPNTYMFQYAPFQMSYEQTIISTSFGDRGNAHSEYLGPLAESGVLGMVTIMIIVIMTIYYGIKVYHESTDEKIKTLVLGVLISLITYFIHGVLNNFLTTDKASATFWGFIGMIVAIDVYHKNRKLKEDKFEEVEEGK